ncbi:PTS transporter subunit EIIC [Facklamia lactis]|uniref:PTS transporter subunit EIIC n=1 Tax=Facklamia lactis TaxID=2749967 RepID=UPI0022A75809|nr:PTS transporter subunit EIIC [Facklamia lactis]
MLNYLQRLGRSLMLPVAVLPIMALLLGIGYAFDPAGWGTGSQIGGFLITAGGAIINNLAILFAVGVALGMSNDRDGSAALAGIVAYLMVTELLSVESISMLTGVEIEEVPGAFAQIGNVFIGMI